MTGAEGRPAAICVTNAKGGTGKTTVAINVAGALNERGRDVLFVDLDPQGNATEGLGLVDAYDAAPPTLFDVLTDPEQRGALSDIVRSHPEMDVVPSNIDMLQAEHELTLSNVMAKLAADPTLDGDPNWLMQTLRVDPTNERTGDLVVRVTERYHVGGETPHVAFEDRFTVRVPVVDDTSPRRIPTVRRALERWYRRAYLDTDDTGLGSAPG
jgi:chromosome partitioning protein